MKLVSLELYNAIGAPVENIWQAPDVMTADVAIGVVCHPHPLYDGTMHNKVVTTVVRAWRELGIASLRYNLRGVGASGGEFDHGQGESQDLLVLVQQLERQFGQRRLHLAGFSFGAYVASLASAHLNPGSLALIAPPVGKAGYSFPESVTSSAPSLIIAAAEDEVVDSSLITAWARQQSHCEFASFAGASHFFHGRLVELRQRLIEYYKNSCASQAFASHQNG